MGSLVCSELCARCALEGGETESGIGKSAQVYTKCCFVLFVFVLSGLTSISRVWYRRHEVLLNLGGK